MEKTWYYGKHYSTMEKNYVTLIHYGKKLWYYGKNLLHNSKI